MLKQFASEELGEIVCFLPTRDAEEFDGDLDFELNMYIQGRRQHLLSHPVKSQVNMPLAPLSPAPNSCANSIAFTALSVLPVATLYI